MKLYHHRPTNTLLKLEYKLCNTKMIRLTIHIYFLTSMLSNPRHERVKPLVVWKGHGFEPCVTVIARTVKSSFSNQYFTNVVSPKIANYFQFIANLNLNNFLLRSLHCFYVNAYFSFPFRR